MDVRQDESNRTHKYISEMKCTMNLDLQEIVKRFQALC